MSGDPSGLRQAIHEAGKEIPINKLNTLGVNRVRVLKANHIESLVTKVVQRQLEERESNFLDEQNSRLQLEIQEKESLLNKADEDSRNSQELSEQINAMKLAYEALQSEIETREDQWEKEKSSLISESQEKINQHLKKEQTQNKTLKLSESAKEKLAKQLSEFVESFGEDPHKILNERQQLQESIKTTLNENAQLKTEIESSQREIEKSQSKNDSLQCENIELVEENQSLTSEQEKLNSTSTQQEEVIQSLTNQQNDLQSRLREALESLRQSNASLAEFNIEKSQLLQQLNEGTKDRDLLKDHLKHFETQLGSLKEEKNQLEEAHLNEAQVLKENLAELENALLLKKRLSAETQKNLETQLLSLEEEKKQSEESLASSKEQNASLKETQLNLEDNNTNLSSTLSEKTKLLDDSHEKIDALEHALLLQKHTSAETQKNLETQLLSLVGEKKRSEENLAFSKELVTSLKETQLKLEGDNTNLSSDLSEKTKQLSDSHEKIDGLEHALLLQRHISDETQTKLFSLEEAQLKLNTTNNDLTSALSEKAELLDSSHEKITELEDSLLLSKRAREEIQKIHATQSEALKQQIEVNNLEISDLNESLEILSAEKAQLTSLESERSREIKSLVKKYSSLQETHHDLLSQKAGLELIADTTRQDNKTLKETNSSLTKELSKIEESHVKLAGQLSNVEMTLSEERGLFARERDELKEKLADAEKNHQTLEGQRAILHEQYESVELKYQESQERCSLIEHQFLQVTSQLQDAQDSNGILDQKILDAESQLRQRQQELARQVQKNAQLRSENEAWKGQLNELEETTAILERHVKEEITRTENLSSKNSHLLDKIEEISDALELESLEKKQISEEAFHFKNQLKVIEERLPELESQAKQNQFLQDECHTWKNRCAELDNQNLSLEQKNKSLQSSLLESSESLKNIQEGYKTWEARCRDYQKSYLESNRALEETKQRATLQEDTIKSLKENLSDFEVVQKEHLNELSTYDRNSEKQSAAVSALENENQQLMNSINELNLQLNNLTENFQIRENEIIEQKQQLLNYKNKIRDQVFEETEKLIQQLIPSKNTSS